MNIVKRSIRNKLLAITGIGTVLLLGSALFGLWLAWSGATATAKTGILLLAAGIFAWRLSGELTRPLHNVISVVSGVAAGDLGVRVMEASKGELGELERGVNHMIDTITHHAQDLMGDMVYVELPQAGAQETAGKGCGGVGPVQGASGE